MLHKVVAWIGFFSLSHTWLFCHRSREARSSQNTIVRTEIQPQGARSLWNEFDGKTVLVASGPKKGLIGKKILREKVLSCHSRRPFLPITRFWYFIITQGLQMHVPLHKIIGSLYHRGLDWKGI